MRDRLIELIAKTNCVETWNHYTDDFMKPNPKKLANKILADGWIRPTARMGQTVYSYCEEFCRVLKYRVANIYLSEETTQYEAFCYIGMELADVIDFDDSDIGKTVFLTRKEALAKLNERKEDEGK